MPKYKYNKLKLQQVSNQLKDILIPIDSFGNTVKDIRESLGMSQKQLANRTSLTQQAIQQIEDNKNSPSIATMQKIAVVFNATISIKLNMEESLEKTIENQAKKKAEILVNNASSNMTMEEQDVGSFMHKSKINEITEDLLENPTKGLWD